MGALDAFTMIGYFYAVRAVGVAIATFFLFLQPVWVAIIAPRFLHTATERVVYFALPVALAGMALILWPSFTDGAVDLSAFGLVAGLSAGWAFAFFQIVVKGLTREVSSITLVTVECLLDALFLLPLALWQFVGLRAKPHRTRLDRHRDHGPGDHGARLHDVDGRAWRGSPCSTARSSGC